jgi:hypothetical protein
MPSAPSAPSISRGSSTRARDVATSATSPDAFDARIERDLSEEEQRGCDSRDAKRRQPCGNEEENSEREQRARCPRQPRDPAIACPPFDPPAAQDSGGGKQRAAQRDQRERPVADAPKMPFGEGRRGKRDHAKLERRTQAFGERPHPQQQREGVDSQQRQSDQAEPEVRRIRPCRQQRERKQQADRRNDSKIALAPCEPLPGGGDQYEQAPMKRGEAAIADEQCQLERADDRRGGAQQCRARPVERHHRQRDGEEKDKAADRKRRDDIERRAREDHPQPPSDPADQRREREPRPAPRARDPGEARNRERKIDREQRHIGFDRSDHRGRGEPAREAEQRAWRSEAERQAERGGSDECERQKREQRPDQLIDVRRDHDCRVKRRDARPGQRLRHADVAQFFLVAPGIFGAADQAEAEQQSGDDLDAGCKDARKEASIDRIANDQDAGDREGEPAGPDRQRLSEQILEPRCETDGRSGGGGRLRRFG